MTMYAKLFPETLAVECFLDLTDEQFAAFSGNPKQSYLRRLVVDAKPVPTAAQMVVNAGYVVEPTQVRQTWALQDISPEVLVANLSASVQSHLDATARTHGYDNIHTAVTYADEPAVPKFQAEGQALRSWRSQVWAHCYQVLDEAQAGTRAIPTSAELIAELPAFVPPQT